MNEIHSEKEENACWCGKNLPVTHRRQQSGLSHRIRTEDFVNRGPITVLMNRGKPLHSHFPRTLLLSRENYGRKVLASNPDAKIVCWGLEITIPVEKCRLSLCHSKTANKPHAIFTSARYCAKRELGKWMWEKIFIIQYLYFVRSSVLNVSIYLKWSENSFYFSGIKWKQSNL